MLDHRKISIAIPTYNRIEMTVESFMQVYDDDRISEIIIVDDASDLGAFLELKEICDKLSKVKLYRNVSNQDCYRNKATAIGYCTNEYAILLDSDNKIDKTYLDAIYLYQWEYDKILTPEYARPNFDFRAYSGLDFSRENIAQYIDRPMFEVMCNAANYFVNVDKYLEAFDDNVNPVTSDSIYIIYKWLTLGGSVYVVPSMQYDHLVHNGSHYQNNVGRTQQGFHENILEQLREMK